MHLCLFLLSDFGILWAVCTEFELEQHFRGNRAPSAVAPRTSFHSSWCQVRHRWHRLGKVWVSPETVLVILAWRNTCVDQHMISSIYPCLFPGPAGQQGFPSATFGGLPFVHLLFPCHPCKQKHTHHTDCFISTVHTLSSQMNAPRRSEYSACTAHQHQLCVLTAPDVSSKMSCICSVAHKEDVWQGETRLLGMPWQPLPGAVFPDGFLGQAFQCRNIDH